MNNAIIDSISEVSGDISKGDVRDSIMDLEGKLLACPQLEIPVTHRYSGGIYCRQITIPEDTILTGRIYADDHYDVMIYGDVTVSGDEGKKRLTGFNIFPGKRGKKRAGYVHKETLWLTFHSCKEMANEKYIDALTCGSFEELPALIGKSEYIEESEIAACYNKSPGDSDYFSFRLGYLAAKGKKSKLTADVEDYMLVLSECGVTEEEVRAQTENKADQIDVSGDFGVKLKESIIEGVGLFSEKNFAGGDIIMPARIDGKRTVAGRYVNHSVCPNATMMLVGDDFYLQSIGQIAIDEEITIDYRIPLDIQAGGALCQQ